mmetsp:Transcript_1012/g.2288  ORF Transcript_1012/g.2288 Transcript_1012/m.2288 type:complete len:229 (-) Transcript_1012:235-921(-)
MIRLQTRLAISSMLQHRLSSRAIPSMKSMTSRSPRSAISVLVVSSSAAPPAAVPFAFALLPCSAERSSISSRKNSPDCVTLHDLLARLRWPVALDRMRKLRAASAPPFPPPRVAPPPPAVAAVPVLPPEAPPVVPRWAAPRAPVRDERGSWWEMWLRTEERRSSMLEPAEPLWAWPDDDSPCDSCAPADETRLPICSTASGWRSRPRSLPMMASRRGSYPMALALLVL